jgi:hypothetical protein
LMLDALPATELIFVWFAADTVTVCQADPV